LSTSIFYVDHSDVRPDAVAELRRAVSELVDFVESREPQLISYGFYIDEEASTMTVLAIHPDSASLELHLAVGGPEFRKVGQFITLRRIEVFGEPSRAALEQLQQKARMLGDAELIVRSADAGFGRLLSQPVPSP
jgi:hypothetical protein